MKAPCPPWAQCSATGRGTPPWPVLPPPRPEAARAAARGPAARQRPRGAPRARPWAGGKGEKMWGKTELDLENPMDPIKMVDISPISPVNPHESARNHTILPCQAPLKKIVKNY